MTSVLTILLRFVLLKDMWQYRKYQEERSTTKAEVERRQSLLKAEQVLNICSLDTEALHLSPSSLNLMQLTVIPSGLVLFCSPWSHGVSQIV